MDCTHHICKPCTCPASRLNKELWIRNIYFFILGYYSFLSSFMPKWENSHCQRKRLYQAPIGMTQGKRQSVRVWLKSWKTPHIQGMQVYMYHLFALTQRWMTWQLSQTSQPEGRVFVGSGGIDVGAGRQVQSSKQIIALQWNVWWEVQEALWVSSWKQDWIQTVTKRTGY